MAGFSGFTDEEIRRFKMQRETLDNGENTREEPLKKAAINPAGKRSRPREKVRTKSSNSKPREKAPKDMKDPVVPESRLESKPQEIVSEEKIVEEKPKEIEVVMEPEKVKELELSNLEKMQQKQKEMEMINKKKQKMLQTALKQRYAKTKKETETLKLVQKELGRLDNLLYTDVQILRDKIDHACREFDAARKRYDRAEAEFINAKVHLHDKTEIKDQLTEHLCSIIQQNEERKAKKLAELMSRLELADQEMNLETEESISEDGKDKTLPTSTESESSNNLLTEQQTLDKKDSENISEPDKKSNEPEQSSLKLDSQIQNNNNNNSRKIEQEQKTVEKNEPDLVEVKEASERLEKT